MLRLVFTTASATFGLALYQSTRQIEALCHLFMWLWFSYAAIFMWVEPTEVQW